MSKRVKILVSVIIALVLLTVGIALPVMAQEETTPTPEAGTKNLIARVAEILNIPEEDLASAFNQVRLEMRQEVWPNALDSAVAKGLITQEEADRIKEWWGQRPEAIDRLAPSALIGQAIRNRKMMAATEQAVEKGRFAQDDAEKLKGWLEQKPEALKRPVPRARISSAIRGRQMIVVRNGWSGTIPPKLAD